MRVSLTGKAAWQMGSTGLGRTNWETVPCDCGLCKTGRFVAVDEKIRLYDDEPEKNRHIAKAALHIRSEKGVILTNGIDAFPPVQAYSPSEAGRGRRR